VQTTIKHNNNWKCTGVYAKKFKPFKIDPELKKIINKIIKNIKIYICGVDLLKKEGKWLVLEVNSNPGLDFFKTQEKNLVEKILIFLRNKKFN